VTGLLGFALAAELAAILPLDDSTVDSTPAFTTALATAFSGTATFVASGAASPSGLRASVGIEASAGLSDDGGMTGVVLELELDFAISTPARDGWLTLWAVGATNDDDALAGATAG
jgi:hypothetical protein